MDLICAQCKKEFQWERPKGRPPLICSPECRRRRHAERELENRWRRRGGETSEVRTCTWCHADFVYERAVGKIGRGTTFCSEDCREASLQAHMRVNAAAYRSRLTPEQKAALRRTALLARYGLTAELYAAMVEAQGAVCAICGRPDTKHHSPLLKMDHDRTCCPEGRSCGKCVRGLLCSACNTALGLFCDNPEILQSAIDYLNRARARARPT